LELPLVAALEESLCCVLFPPAATLVARWAEVAEAWAVCVVGALWTMVWDCPPDAPPPVCVCVTVWVVLLLFDAVAVALDELV
jgi:hypothetical protein